MNLKELLDYSDGNIINTRLTNISHTSYDNKLNDTIYGNNLCGIKLKDSNHIHSKKLYCDYNIGLPSIYTSGKTIERINNYLNLSASEFSFGHDFKYDESNKLYYIDTGDLIIPNDIKLNIDNNYQLVEFTDNPDYIINYLDLDKTQGLIIKGKISGVMAITGVAKGSDKLLKSSELGGEVTSSKFKTDYKNSWIWYWGSYISYGTFKGYSSSSLVFVGVQYYIKLYYDLDNNPKLIYHFYFEDNNELNYHPYVYYSGYGDGGSKRKDHAYLLYNEFNSDKKLIEISLGLNKLFDIYNELSPMDPGSINLLTVKEVHKESVRRKVLGISVGWHNGWITTINELSLKFTHNNGSGLIILTMLNNIDYKDALSNAVSYPSMVFFNSPESKLLSYDISELSDPDLLFKENDVTGFMGYYTCDPLDAINNPHLDLKHFRGYLNSLPEDIGELYPAVLVNDSVSVNNIGYYCDRIDEVNNDEVVILKPHWELLPVGETPSISKLELVS